MQYRTDGGSNQEKPRTVLHKTVADWQEICRYK